MWDWNQVGIVEDNDILNMMNTLNYCSEEYHATEYGCNVINDEWQRNKGTPFDERFKGIEGFVPGKHYIEIHSTYLRRVNPKEIKNFFYNLDFDCRVVAKVNGRDKDWWYREYHNAKDIIESLRYVPANCIDYHGLEEQKTRFDVAKRTYSSMPCYTPESETEYRKRKNAYSVLIEIENQYLTEQQAVDINDAYPELKARAGQRTSRVVKKLCIMIGLDKMEGFERRYAKYADAINPIEVPEIIRISWNKLDYVTMSFGKNWTSCQSPDKFDIHDYCNKTAGYGGCASAGLLSYMLDHGSIVMYSVTENDAKSGLPFWAQPKLRRQMFHISPNGTTFCQGRLYPDDQRDNEENDGEDQAYEIYKPWREIFQHIISQAYGLPNLWKNKQGTSECFSSIHSTGTHYRDYECYPNCNISWNSEAEKETVYIGHNPLCPSCGKEHNERDWCTCEVCREGIEYVHCENCGERIDVETAIEYEGYYYCRDCTNYCQYHDRQEPNNVDNFVEHYGNVCDEALNRMLEYGEAYECEQCNCYFEEGYGETLEDEETGEIHDFCSCGCRDRWQRMI